MSVEIVAAIAHDAQSAFVCEAVEIDQPREDEILVRIAGVGICHTDLVWKSAGRIPYPLVLGHEGAGIVERIGAKVSNVQVGDRVIISFRSCGGCVRCTGGLPCYCNGLVDLNFTGARTDGIRALRQDGRPVSSNFFGQSSFATHALTYERNVVLAPADLPLEICGPLACGVQTGAGAVMRSLACEVGTSILILGGGAVGLSAVMGAKIRGCSSIIVLEPHEERRQLAMELGATHVLDPNGASDLSAAVRAIVSEGADYAFDTTGIPELIEKALLSLGSHGTLGIVGANSPDARLPGTLRELIFTGRTIKGIIEGDSDPQTFIPELIEHYRAGRLPFDKLVKTYPLSAINEAVRDQHDGKCVKAVLIP